MEVFASPWGQSTRPVRYPRIVRPKGQNTILEEQKRGLSCEECGKKLKQITWMHLRKHELTVDQYKEKYHFPYHQGLTSESTKQKKRDRQIKLMALGRVKLITSADPKFYGGDPHKKRKSPVIRIGRPGEKNPVQSQRMKVLYANKEWVWESLKRGRGIKTCFICGYEHKDKIEAMIRNEIHDEEIAKVCPVTRTSIQRHRRNCMGITILGRHRGSQRREMDCTICGKRFVYYHYSYYKYERRICSNACKSKYMKTKNGSGSQDSHNTPLTRDKSCVYD